MATPNTGATPTGPMTFEQGLAAFKAKKAALGVTSDQMTVNKLDENGLEVAEDDAAIQPEATDEPAVEENAESVSADESQEQTEEPDTRPIILPDGSEITAEEARKGYLRQADYTRKTQTLSQMESAFLAEKQNAVKQFSTLYQQVASLQEQEPNWLQIAQDPNTDPKQLQAAQAYWQNKKNVMAQAQTAIRQAEQQALQAAQARAYQALNSGEFNPAWKDPKALQAGLATITEYLTERGLPADLLSQVSNHVLIEIAEESRQFRELQKQKPKAALAVKGKPMPFKPGSKATATPQAENLRSLQEAFRKNPTIDNATKLTQAKAAVRR